MLYARPVEGHMQQGDVVQECNGTRSVPMLHKEMGVGGSGGARELPEKLVRVNPN